MVLKLVDNAIMRECKAVLTEARPNFYAKHCFHHTLELQNLVSDGGNPTLNITFLDQKFLLQPPQHMRHISFGLRPGIKDLRLYRDEIEQLLPQYLETVAISCPQLHKLDLHFISGPPHSRHTVKARNVWGSWQAARIVEGRWQTLGLSKMEWEGAIVRAIQNIIMQTRLSHFTVSALASIEPENVFTGLCLSLAPRHQWIVSNYCKWEALTHKLNLARHDHIIIFDDNEQRTVQRWSWVRK